MKKIVSFTCAACIALMMLGCGDSGTEQQADSTDPTDLAEAQRKVEEAQQLLEQAQTELEQAKENRPAFVPPADHLEPFNHSFGFGNPDEVAHFWHWAQGWTFKPEHATNTQKSGGAILASNYRLAGDFQVKLKGRLTQSWTNSRKSVFQLCGQSIGLASWKPVGIDLTVKRAGNQLTYTLNDQEPVAVVLTEEQAGPAQLRLIVYGRYVFINQLELIADAADRIVE